MSRAVWTKLLADADASSIQRSSQTLSVIAGYAFIYGGELRPREPVNSAVYRIAVGRDGVSNNQVLSALDNLPNPPQPRVGAASTVIHDKIYVFSGRGGTAMAPIEEAGSFWVFDPNAAIWSQVKPADPQRPYPVGRSYHALSNDGKDTIFLHAGCPEKGRLCDLWAFTVSSREWREMPSAPRPERGGTSMTYAEAKLYRMNGFDGKTEQGGALDVFDLKKEIWSSITYPADGISGPAARSVSCLLPLTVRGKSRLVTMFGEHDPSSLGHQGAGKMLSDAWFFDIGSQQWAKIRVDAKNTPPARGWFAADVGSDPLHPHIVVHGGLAESNERLGDVWRLEFEQ